MNISKKVDDFFLKLIIGSLLGCFVISVAVSIYKVVS